MSNRNFSGRARFWLVAGLASVLAACATGAGGGGSASAAWPSPANVVADQKAFAPDKLAELDARMKEAVDKGQVTGVQYALFKDGKLDDFKVYGNQSFDGPPMTPNTLFRIRSMSKPITGVAMMQLYEQGKWKLDDPVTKFVPEFANLKVITGEDPTTHEPIIVNANRPATMQELFTHTAGLGYGLSDRTPTDRMFIADNPMTKKDFKAMIDRIAAIPLLAQPGEKWSYSIGIDVQGAIVERISGMTFGEYLKKNIFTPLGMNDSGFWLTEKDRPRFAEVITRDPKTGKMVDYPDLPDRDFFKPDHEESGGGGLVSTTHDYARFVQMLLNKGELDGHRILKAETVDMMFKNHLPDGVSAMGGGGWGLGGAITGPTNARSPQPEGTFWWFGIDGSWFWADAKNNLGFVGMIQRRGGGGPGAVDFRGDSARIVYDALQK
ncbi:MAG: serine hydrolase [Alphaproteobacteria bacterium]|nr:serine hydrolase [Alphaproteobacteria bacterium]